MRVRAQESALVLHLVLSVLHTWTVWPVAVYCSVLQCVVVCCSVLQCDAVCCSMLQCVATCQSIAVSRIVLQRVNLLQWVVMHGSRRAVPHIRATCVVNTGCLGLSDFARKNAVCCSVLQCVAVCDSLLQCVTVCCSVLQCVVVCCSVLH